MEIQNPWPAGVGICAFASTLSANEEGQLLLQFKQSIRDPDGILSNWNNLDYSPCQWSGVNCTSGFVTSVNLYNNNLTGSVWKADQPHPFEPWVTRHGSIPDKIGNLPKLQCLSLNVNPFVGPLPSSISKLKNLRAIYVGLTSNFTVAPIPYFGDMVDLEVLSLVACQFTAGPFPSWVEGMTKLTMLDFTDCNLEGPKPQFPENMTGMITLNLNNNSLSGTIPDIFGGMKNLVQVGFEVNMFTGAILASLWQCTKLSHVELWMNSLNRSLPEEIGYRTNLVFIDVTTNKWSGPIPASLGNLTNLQHLFLSQNQFTGEIPPGVSNFTNLEVFCVFDNQIGGILPYDFGARMTSLSVFDVSNNLLEGLISPSLCNGDVLVELHFGGNNFSNLGRKI